MKLQATILATVLGLSAAFAPSQQSLSFGRTRHVVYEEAVATAEDVAVEVAAAPAASTCISREEILSSPDTTEFGSMWDPLGLASMGSEETLAWFRHSEVKHGRIAMAAFVGWCVVAAGVHFPGELTHGVPFASLPTKALDAWAATPGFGKTQMLIFAGLIEFHDELFHSRRGTHYLKGGTPGKNMVPGLYDPFGIHANDSEEKKARGRACEIKNGRLAMIGFMGLYAAATISGSVPLLGDI